MDFLRTVSVFLLSAFLPVRAQFNLVSPGPLAQPHAALEGQSNCFKCHQEGKQVVGDRCLSCHTELAPKIERREGYHGRLANVRTECGHCHPDHAGRDFDMILWEKGKNNFDHNLTGYSLKGSHAKVACEGCHDSRRVKDPIVLNHISVNHRKETYLGLSTKCSACHFDEHRGQVSKPCESCHSESGWKEANGFNHSKTKYPLLGKHRQVACSKCHAELTDTRTSSSAFPKPIDQTYLRLSGMPFKSCENCHQDVHQGKLGKDCRKCHSEAGWTVVDQKIQGDRAFHQKTRYPLEGAHGSVGCPACHGPFPGTKAKFKGLEFGDCTDCHFDAHLGQFAAKMKTATGVKTCDRCHTVTTFESPEYSLTDHRACKYPLEGAHAAVPCNKCHAQERALAQRISSKVRAELKRRKRPETFSYARFDFRGDLNRCETCHEDPHGGQFVRDGKAKSCTTCHRIESFQKFDFDHNRDTRYPLTGAHEKVACGSCHPNGRYRGAPLVCEGCHEDVHAGQFVLPDGKPKRCETCHTTKDFKKEILFDHNNKKFTDFRLDGRHSSLPCVKCHPVVLLSPTVKVSRYKSLPTTCEGCHDDQHKGRFKGFEP